MATLRLPLPDWLAHEVEHDGAPSDLSSWWLGFLFKRLCDRPGSRQLIWADGGGCRGRVGAERGRIATIVEARATEGGGWVDEPRSPFNRSIGPDTRVQITGPLAGHPLLQTSADPSGRRLRGVALSPGRPSLTPWGTLLVVETDPGPRVEDAAATEPNERSRFGYVVEVDPYDPHSTPRKHSALGRLQPAAVISSIARDGRAVVYLFEGAGPGGLYKFESAAVHRHCDRSAGSGLLEAGTLYSAAFNPGGGGRWVPLTYGIEPLVERNRFHSQAEVLLNARRAARLAAHAPAEQKLSRGDGEVRA
jgi:uncharacterized protein